MSTTYPIISVLGAHAIHRTDWQGRQLLYPTPRTNYYQNSQSNYSGVWQTGANGSAYLSSTALAPDGTNTAGVCQSTLAGDTQTGAFSAAGSSTPAGTAPVSMYIAPYDGQTQCTCYLNWTGVSNNSCTVDLVNQTVTNNMPSSPISWSGEAAPNGFTKVTATYAFAGGEQPQFIVPWPQATANAGGVIVWGVMFGAGSYIPTPSDSPVTLTDYALTGTTVNLAQVPATGAILDWTGTGTYATVA
jgi:hypothetical protein